MYPTRRFRLLEYHGNMLSDRRRVDAYAKALRQAVPPGARVLDVGTGTGLLAMLAARAGAGRVDAVEIAEVVEIARRVAAHNDLDRVVRFHQALSFHLQLPERAELLVTETLGNFGLEEGILATVLDARFRLLVPGAPIIPAEVALFVRPLEHPEEARKLQAYRGEVAGLDYRPLAAEADHLLWYTRFSEKEALGPRAALGGIDLTAFERPRFFGRAPIEIARDGVLHGLGGTFRATLIPGVDIHNEPDADGAPSWRQAFLPVDGAWPVRAGDRLEVEVETWDGGEQWRWRVEGAGHAFEGRTDRVVGPA